MRRPRVTRPSLRGPTRRIRRWRPPTVTGAARAARSRLARFRKRSVLAVAVTALLLLVWGVPESRGQDTDAAPDVPDDVTEAVAQATDTLGDLLRGFYGMAPKIVIAIACLLLAAALHRLVNSLLKRTLGNWNHAAATSAMVGVVLWVVALGVALSVIAGDASALVGSVGLGGLALSWALQAPIESFTGWLLNSFRGYYRIGDRIAVGDVFGDVYAIDVLTTTLWEAGGPGKSVQAAQPTGALVTFPNSELLRANIVNYSRDFPYVWDEVTVSIANESDLGFAKELALRVAIETLGPSSAAASVEYAALLRRAGLAWEVATDPQAYFSGTDFWTSLTIRYTVPVRERRKWSSELFVALETAIARHPDRIGPAYVREHHLELARRAGDEA